MVSALGTTTLSIFLSAILLIGSFAFQIIPKYCQGREQGITMKQVFKESFRQSFLITIIFYIICVFFLFSWETVNFIYHDHKSLLNRISVLKTIKDTPVNDCQLSIDLGDSTVFRRYFSPDKSTPKLGSSVWYAASISTKSNKLDSCSLVLTNIEKDRTSILSRPVNLLVSLTSQNTKERDEWQRVREVPVFFDVLFSFKTSKDLGISARNYKSAIDGNLTAGEYTFSLQAQCENCKSQVRKFKVKYHGGTDISVSPMPSVP
jgi:hypothetical protein